MSLLQAGSDFVAGSDLANDLHVKLHLEVIEIGNISGVGNGYYKTLFRLLQRDKIVTKGQFSRQTLVKRRVNNDTVQVCVLETKLLREGLGNNRIGKQALSDARFTEAFP